MTTATERRRWYDALDQKAEEAQRKVEFRRRKLRLEQMNRDRIEREEERKLVTVSQVALSGAYRNAALTPRKSLKDKFWDAVSAVVVIASMIWGFRVFVLPVILYWTGLGR